MRMSEKRIREYLLVFYLIYCFGTPVFAFYYHQFLVFNLVMGALGVLANKKINSGVLLVFTILSLSMLIAQMINLDLDLSTPFAICSIIIFSIACINVLTVDIFEEIFVKLMVIISVVSDVIYGIALVFPGLIQKLPVFHGTGEYPNIAYIFFLPAMSHRYSSILVRNEGMFCEMGIFASLIVFALLVILKNDAVNSRRRTIILLLTLITTLSTTGIIAAVLLMPELYRKVFKGYKWNFLFIIAFAGGISVKYELLARVLFSKFNSQSGDYGSFTIRFYGMLKDIEIWAKNPFGIGMNKYLTNGVGSANTITFFAAAFGIVFCVLSTYGVVRYFANCKDSVFNLLRAAAVVVCISTQGMSTYPLFYVVLLYGLSRRERGKIEYEYSGASI